MGHHHAQHPPLELEAVQRARKRIQSEKNEQDDEPQVMIDIVESEESEHTVPCRPIDFDVLRRVRRVLLDDGADGGRYQDKDEQYYRQFHRTKEFPHLSRHMVSSIEINPL
jgi:hypothetical protein